MSSIKLVVFFSFFFISSFFLSQVVEERIHIDTTIETISVVYKPVEKSTYYYKKIAVFANDTSQVAVEKSFNNLGQNGVYKTYYPSGRLKIMTVFANNKINGEWTYYDPNGIIITKGIYKNGVKHGYWTYKSLKIYGRYKNGYKNRKWKRIDKNEKKYQSHYKNGILTGGEGYEGDEKIDGVPVRRNIFAKVFPKKIKQNEGVVNEKDTIRGEKVEEYQGTAISKEYQQAISFLSTNALFRRNVKSYFGGSVKKYFKKDKFQFAIKPEVKNLSMDYFLKESEAGKIIVSNIDSVLKNNKENLVQFFANQEVIKNEGLPNNSTNIESLLKVVFSEVEYNLMRVDIHLDEDKKYQLLLYFDSEGILKGAEYEKP